MAGILLSLSGPQHKFQGICAAGTRNPLHYLLAGNAPLRVQCLTFSSAGVRTLQHRQERNAHASVEVKFLFSVNVLLTVIMVEEAAPTSALYSSSVSPINVLRLLSTEAENCQLFGRR